jgi:hypothetical protein
MTNKISIKGNIIKYDKKTKLQDIEEILASRFSGEEFLPNNLDSLHDPYLFKDMKKAVERLKKAKKESERIFIF